MNLKLEMPGAGFAIPRDVKAKNEVNSGERIGSIETHLIEENQIGDQEFVTRTFFIKYWDEEVKLNELVVFRMELPVGFDFPTTPLYIYAQLYFGDCKGNVEEVDLNLEFNCFSTICLQIHKPWEETKWEYLQILFEENFSSCLSGVFSVIWLEYKFKNDTSLPLSRAVAGHLFRGKNGTVKSYIGQEETNGLYNRFAGGLIRAYEHLYEYFNFMTTALMTSNKREELQGGTRAPNLTLPGNPIQVPYSLIKRPNGNGTETHRKVIKKFADRVASHDPEKLVKLLISETHMLSQQLFQLWNRVCDASVVIPKLVCEHHFRSYVVKQMEHYGHNLIRSSHVVQEFEVCEDPMLLQRHSELFTSQIASHTPPLPIQLLRQIDRVGSKAMLIEEVFMKARSDSDSLSTMLTVQNAHLIVMVHGFQGNSMDMRVLKACLSSSFPGTIFLSSISNEDDSDACVWEMGKNLAEEVQNYINDWCSGQIPGRISFIGHSLGGIIIRAALPHLESIKDSFHFYMSLASPHLGYMRAGSKIVDAGMWLIKRWSNSKSLQQITYSDVSNLRQSAMFDLSKASGLDAFSHIFLISSEQDSYVHFDSARIEIGPKAKHARQPEIYAEMVRNILSQLSNTKLHKINVKFFLSGASFDNFIGRSAHMMYLENTCFMNTFKFRYWNELFS